MTPSLSLQPRRSLISRQSPSQDIPATPITRSRPATAQATPFNAKRTSSPLTAPPLEPSRSASPPAAQELAMVPPPPPPQDDQELQELRAKIRVLEAKRADDARHVRELESRLADAEAFVAVRPKLQAKLTSLQTDLTETRRELADAQQLSQLAETRLIDSQEQLEMVMLDKEVAEERAELAEAELEDLKERLAILEVEVDVLKAGMSFHSHKKLFLMGKQNLGTPKILQRETPKRTFNLKSRMKG